MDAFLVSIGHELTTGQTVDTNGAWLAAELTRLGVRVTGHLTIGDDTDAIRMAIAFAIDASDLVIATGGLGPTPDDLTREGVAAALGRPLVESAEAMAQLRVMFRKWGRAMHPANAKQALVPEGCDIIPNPGGTAPGLACRSGATRLVALPGVPSEMRAMFHAGVVPSIEEADVTGRFVVETVKCFGMSEARVGELLKEMMVSDRDPRVGTSATNGVITVRVVGDGADEAEASSRAGEDAREITRRLGEVVFGRGDDTLELIVGRLLRGRKETVAVAESCTGGLLGTRLTKEPGSSDCFLRGYVTYSNDAKVDVLGVPAEVLAEHGAVSEAVAEAMVSGCRTAAGSDYALSITGIAGPGGGRPPEMPVGLVFIGLADKAGVTTERFLLGEHLSRAGIRERACSVALNLLRLRLIQDDTT